MISKAFKLLIISATLALTACSITPQTVANAVRGHALFPSLSMAVSDCLAGDPQTRDQVRPHYNALVDLWSEAKELEAGDQLISALVNAQAKVAEAKSNWISAKTIIASSGVQCSQFVVDEVANIEATFVEISDALRANERFVLAAQWTQIIGRIALGQGGQVARL